MSCRLSNCLKQIDGAFNADRSLNMEILTSMSEAEMLRLPNFGRKSLKELKEIFNRCGVVFKHAVTKNHEGFWPKDRDIYIYRMREAGYKFTEVGEVFGITGARAGVIHLEVRELIDESPMFKRYVDKNDINKEENL